MRATKQMNPTPGAAFTTRPGRFLRWALAGALWAGLAGGAFAQKVLVKAESGLSLRSKANTSASKIETLSAYAPVDVRKRDGEWAFVTAPSGKTGWVLSSYLTKTPFVTTNADTANIREGPGTNYDEKMKVGKHYPFKVLDVAEGWIKVEDCDGDRGWISQKLISLEPYVITISRDDDNKPANIRKGPTTEDEVVFTADKGVILKVLKEKNGWLQVEHEDGDQGWTSAKNVFGWLD